MCVRACSSRVSQGVTKSVVPLKRVDTSSTLYVYQPVCFDWIGPKPPTPREVMSSRYVAVYRCWNLTLVAGELCVQASS